MDEKLTLNDGTVLFNSHVNQVGVNLWVYIGADMTLGEAFELLYDLEKTEKITAERYGVITEYNGFTDLRNITAEDSGQISAGLRKAVD